MIRTYPRQARVGGPGRDTAQPQRGEVLETGGGEQGADAALREGGGGRGTAIG